MGRILTRGSVIVPGCRDGVVRRDRVVERDLAFLDELQREH
jgi:hypothetical protein